MIPADFEESEFRGPLYNQLERGNHLVWEPGQVFEKHIGIDRAAFVTDRSFWALHGRTSPLGGVVLLDYDWDYIWRSRIRQKALPDFSLNLFLQAKRPQSGTRPRIALRRAGLAYNYWKFEVTPHQQVALEKMSHALSSKAVVCYAAPAFHTQAALYEHTKHQSIVSATTFPSCATLIGHGAWYYDHGGVGGVPNPDFAWVDVPSLERRIADLVSGNEGREVDARGSLRVLADALIQSAAERPSPSSMDTWFQQQLQSVEESVETAQALGFDEGLGAPLRHFRQVRAFCNAYRLDWYVLGRGV